ncbi:hypothetical protein AMOR_52160 [Anaeromyxobacter oryzae]|uniref:BPP domain-containing protein n=2 Tax=Anaeromyxobacter oryzae TaxID=2918170 RepID=A0ABM7X334_9BACT|nr:hypothetical protein AMOR_52160 [Anaeromyxobacter oryzae]
MVVAIGCGAEQRNDPAPLDRFTFPTGIAVHGQDLLVVSSNFDLQYASADGGSLLRVALGAAPAIQPGGLRIGSFGGELTVVDPARCPALGGTEALVTSRLQGRLYRIGLDGNALTCGAACEIRFDDDKRLGDPYGIGVTCPAGGTPRAWVGFLRTPLREAFIATIDLTTGARQVLSVGAGQVRSFAYDADTERLFFTSVDTQLAAPLSWIELASGCDPTLPENAGGCVVRAADLWGFLRGAELSGLDLSNPVPGQRRRVYVATKVYDADLAATLGTRPGFDVTGELMVLELAENATGNLEVKLVKTLYVGLGAAEVKVLPRRPNLPCNDASGVSVPNGCPQRDLVAITASEDGLFWIYDDETGTMRDVFGRDPQTGQPGLGRSPFGLAVQDLRATPGTGDGNARVYVGSFLDDFVTAVDVPLSGSAPADFVRAGTGPSAPPQRIGQVTP